MVKLLFVHDSTFAKDSECNYYGTAVNDRTLERYKHIADDVTVAIRTVDLTADDDKSRYSLISKEYSVISIPNLMSVRGLLVGQREVRSYLWNLVDEYDCVVARLSGLVGCTAADVCREKGVPCVVECVGAPRDSLRSMGVRGRLVAPYIDSRASRAVRGASHVIYVTNEYLQRTYPTKGKWTPCSNVTLPVDMFETEPNRVFKGDSLDDYRGKRLVFGSAGKINLPYKGYQYALAAIAKMKEVGFDVEYQLAGNGDPSFIQSVARKYGVEDNLNLMGSMPHDDVIRWMSALDLYLQPSDTEGLPRALIEAMGTGCPCVGSDAAGIPELLNRECIFGKGNVDELYERIMYVLPHSSSESARNRDASRDYAFDVITNRRNDFFDMFARDCGLK